MSFIYIIMMAYRIDINAGEEDNMAKILLLEDDESLNRGISLKLEKEGYEVLNASKVTDAEALFHGNDIDLIISDIMVEEENVNI